MWRKAVMCVFIANLAGAGAGGPQFPAWQRRGAVGVRGQPASLDCLVAAAPPYTVSWVRTRDLQILSHGGAVFTADPRVSLTVSGPESGAAGGAGPATARLADVTRHRLTIAELRDSDAGRYECQLNTEPKMSLFFRLTVLDEAVAEAAAEWAAEHRATPPPTIPSSSEAMQRDESAAASEAARRPPPAPVTSLLLLLLLLLLRPCT